MGKREAEKPRNQLKKESGKERILELLSRGIWVKAELVRQTGFPYSTVSTWVEEIYAEWRCENMHEADIVIRRQLRELVWERKEAQEQWERSKQSAVSVTEKIGKKEPDEISTTTKGQCGDPRYLSELRELRAEERDIHGIGKGSGGGTSEKAEDLSKLTKAEVIERYLRRFGQIPEKKEGEEEDSKE